MSISHNTPDIAQFESEWVDLARKICQVVYTKPEVQVLKNVLVKNGYLTLEEKSRFIDVCDQTKYEIIYARYGDADSEGYKTFSQLWQNWFQAKGVESQKFRNQKSSVDHIFCSAVLLTLWNFCCILSTKCWEA
jgi:hypothetical protein